MNSPCARRRKGLATGGDSPNAEDTFAKLLRAHASLRGTRPAFRHKDLGLWQTWTWGQVYEETRAIAQGLIGLGLERGQTIAIVGANRPRLYWSITAAQMIGAVPVPVYADAAAEEIAALLDHSEAAIVIAQDQERVDKILSMRRSRSFATAGSASAAPPFAASAASAARPGS
jgi:long-chain acyl-CoA synthetase